MGAAGSLWRRVPELIFNRNRGRVCAHSGWRDIRPFCPVIRLDDARCHSNGRVSAAPVYITMLVFSLVRHRFCGPSWVGGTQIHKTD